MENTKNTNNEKITWNDLETILARKKSKERD